MKDMTKKEVQKLSLEILKDVHDFCVKNGIRYTLSGGTLLGAIRHNGFIPWDDDIDIQLPRPDFDRLVHEYKSDKGFKILYNELPGCEKMSYPYARVCDTKRTLVDGGILVTMPEDVGVWIDVLPCDGISSDEKEAQQYFSIVKKYVYRSYWQGVRMQDFSAIKKGRNIEAKIKFLGKKIVATLLPKDPLKKLMKLRRKYKYEDSEYFFCTIHYGMKERQPKYIMEKFELHKFEDKEFYVTSAWHENLQRLYGDYMKLPPEDKRESHDYNYYYWR